MTELLIDVGKSGVRCHSSTGAVTAGPGIRPELAGSPGGGLALASAITAAAADLTDPADQVSTVVIGSTAVPVKVDDCYRGLHRQWPHARIALAEDGVVAHAVRIGGPGALAAFGTGTILLGLTPGGSWHRIDGWGPDLGDRASAFAIGRAGIRAVFDAHDRIGEPTALTEAFVARIGTPGLDLAIELLADPRRVEIIAEFAATVGALAATDPIAAAVIDDAVADAARSCAAICDRSQTDRITVIGGVAGAERFRSGLAAALSERRVQLEPTPPIDVGAAQLIFTDPYRSWVL